MWKPEPICEECGTDISPWNLFVLCEDCYDENHCKDCDMKLDGPKAPCTLCNIEDLEREGA